MGDSMEHLDLEKPWRDTYKRLMALDRDWEKERFRKAAIADLHCFLVERCAHVPHLGDLARLAREQMTRQDLFAMIVPCERELKRVKVTDVEILSQDLSAASEPAPKMSLTVIADNFRSAINVGTLFRVSDCFGIEEALLCGYTPDPADGRAKSAALGAENWVKWSRFPRTLDAVRAVQARGIPVIVLETVEDAPTLESWQWQFPCAIALGSERFGLDADVIKACDGVMRIPMFGRKNSLNVVMAFTIVAHAARQAFEQQSGR
jgi:tRNA G18 (ribose-2'-O)-methylase SpoU